jgi:hypothetical protein
MVLETDSHGSGNTPIPTKASRNARKMNRYKPSTPRGALRLTALAMATITMGALVVLPAKLEFVTADSYTLAATKASIDVAVSPTHIDVPKSVGHEEHVQSDRTTLGVQEFRGTRYHLSSRSRIHS